MSNSNFLLRRSLSMESYEKNMAFINSNFENPNPNDFVFPVGYRFCPRDDELITHYLLKRIRNEVLPHDKIKEVNLYKYSPYDLAGNFLSFFLISIVRIYISLVLKVTSSYSPLHDLVVSFFYSFKFSI